MKVFLTIWILAVLIQEVIPSTLVRLPRHSEKNLSSVHTEYEAKYEQKGKHGNESFSSVSGKQEIVHDNCAENWNSFAEKCASLIKDLVASLANAVSSKPGDATNLQLHIKNTFKHFDNTHNCTCLNHTAKTLSDLNLSPLFKNISINTVEPSTKADAENESGAKYKKYRGEGQPCGGDNEDRNITPESNGFGDDKNGLDQKEMKENGQPLDELWDKHTGKFQTLNDAKSKIFDEKLTEKLKQLNLALDNAKDLDVNPENDEASSDQSTINSRRQIKYPQNLTKPQTVSKNSGDSDFNPLADDLSYSSSNTKRPEGVRYPFLVTSRPNPQSANPFKSPAAVLNPASLSGSSLDSDSPNSPECEPSNVLLALENSSASTSVPLCSTSVKSNAQPSSASYLLTSPNNGNSSPNNNYMHPAAQVVTEPHSSIYNEEDPKEVLPLNNPGLNQKSISQPINPMNNRNHQSPAIISEEPITKNYNSEPAILIPAKSVNNKPYAQSAVVLPEDQQIYNRKSETEVPVNLEDSQPNPQFKQLLPEKPITDNQALNRAPIPVEQLESDLKLMPSVMQLENPISNIKSTAQPIAILPKSPLLVESAGAEAELPVMPVSSEPNTSSPVILPKEAVTGNHVLKPGFIPAEQVESGPYGISSPITRSNQQPTVIHPEKPKTEDYATDPSKIVLDDNKRNIDSPEPIPAVSVQSVHSAAFPEELSFPKNIKLESSGLISENSAGSKYNSESPLFIQNKKTVEEAAEQWLQFTTPKAYDSGKTSDEGNTKSTTILNIPKEEQGALKRLTSGIPETDSNKNYAQPSEPESDVVMLNPSSTYKPLTASLSSNLSIGPIVPDKNPATPTPEDIFPVAADGQSLKEDLNTIKSPIYKPSSTGSSSSLSIGPIVPDKNPATPTPEDILPVAADGQSLKEDLNTIKSPIYKPSSTGSSSSLSIGPIVPDKNPATPTPEDILPVAADGQSLKEDLNTIKSPIYKPSSTGSSSSLSIGPIVPDKNPAILTPEDILPIAAGRKPFFEEQTTTECDQTTEDGLENILSKTKPIPAAPEIATLQSGISIPIEKQLHDKLNQLPAPDLHIPGHPAVVEPEFAHPQKPFFSTQNSDAVIANSPMKKLQYPQQSIQEMNTTPLPFYPVKSVTVIPGVDQSAVITEGPRVYESQGKDFIVTEIPTIFNIPGASITKDQQRQPSKVIPGSTPLNEKPVNTPVASEIAKTPVIIYPVKSFPISSHLEQSNHESSHPVLATTGFSNDNQKPEKEAVPTSPVNPLQVIPMITEQENGNGDSPLQPTATTESGLESDSPNEQERPLTYGPFRDSDIVQHTQAIVKPDKTSAQLTPPVDDHPHNTIDLISVPSSTGDSETIPVISSEPQLETAVSPTPLKPAQPGVLIQNTEPHSHKEQEQNPLLIRPTTFQTTSEDPTPGQVNLPGLLTHTTSVPQDSDETMPVRPSSSPKTTTIYEHDDDDEEDCCSCESCTEEEITDPKQYKETACKNLEEARKELKAIFDKIKKKLKCGRKTPQTITSS